MLRLVSFIVGPASLTHMTHSETASLGYEYPYEGGGGYVKPFSVGGPLEFYYSNDENPGPFTTFEVVAQDCQLWAIVNGTGTPPPFKKRDANDIWQFQAANDWYNKTISYEGAGSPNANAALRLQKIPVSQPKLSYPPKNDTKCLTVDDYFHSNESRWQFGFMRKEETIWSWLAFDEDPYNFVYYWYGIQSLGVGTGTGYRPANWFDVKINP